MAFNRYLAHAEYYSQCVKRNLRSHGPSAPPEQLGATLDRLESAIPHIVLGWQRATAHLGSDVPALEMCAGYLNIAMVLLSFRSLPDELLPCLERLIGASRNANNEPLALDATRQLAAAYKTKGQYNSSKDLYMDALESARLLYRTEHEKLMPYLLGISGLHSAAGQLEEAREWAERACVASEEAGSSDFLLSCISLGRIYVSLGQYDDAEKLIVPALKLFRGGPTGGAVLVAGMSIELARLYRMTKRLDDAERILDSALGPLEAASGPGNRFVFQARLELARVRRAQSRLTEAERVLDSAKSAFTALGDVPNELLTELGLLYRKQRRYKGAEETLSRVLENVEHTRAGLVPLGHALYNLALVKRDLKKFRKAKSLFRRAFDLLELAEPKPPGLHNVAKSIVKLYSTEGKLDSKEPLLRRARSVLDTPASTPVSPK